VKRLRIASKPPSPVNSSQAAVNDMPTPYLFLYFSKSKYFLKAYHRYFVTGVLSLRGLLRNHSTHGVCRHFESGVVDRELAREICRNGDNPLFPKS